MSIEAARRVRVLHVLSSCGIGGIERTVPRLRGPLLREGIEIEAAGLAPEGPAAALARERGLPFHVLDARSPIAQILALRALVRSGRFEILHAYGTRAIAASRVAALLCSGSRIGLDRPRVITGLLSTRGGRGTAKRLAERLTRIGNDLHVANAAAVARARIAADGIRGSSVWVVHDGIDPLPRPSSAASASSADSRAAIRRSLGIGDGDPVAICVANLRPMKGHATLLEAFAHVREERPRARLLLAGEDRMDGALQRRAAALGLAGDAVGAGGQAVLFLGPREDVDALLAAADLFVLASDFEGLPISILEAMRAGLPSVATAVSGIPEAVRDGTEGLLVPPRDAGALARAIATLFADPPRATRMGEAAEARFEALFTTDRSAAALAAVYRNLLARQGCRTRAEAGPLGSAPIRGEACSVPFANAMQPEER